MRVRPVQQNWKLIGTYGTVGLELAFSILIGFFAGQWLDQKLGVSPWLTIVGFGFGCAAGIRFLIRATRSAQREMERLDREERAARRRFHAGSDQNGDA